MQFDRNGLELLDEDKCLALLGTREMGRIGMSMSALPVVVPVLYQLVDRDILIRTTRGSKLEAAWNGAVVAFEVDDFDPATRAGWSVLVRGPSRVVPSSPLLERVSGPHMPQVLADASEGFVAIRCEMVTGRRVQAGAALGSHVGWLGNLV